VPPSPSSRLRDGRFAYLLGGIPEEDGPALRRCHQGAATPGEGPCQRYAPNNTPPKRRVRKPRKASQSRVDAVAVMWDSGLVRASAPTPRPG
jgi:hypothetical protein